MIDVVTIIAIATTAFISLIDLIVNCAVCCKNREFRSSCCSREGVLSVSIRETSDDESSDDELEKEVHV